MSNALRYVHAIAIIALCFIGTASGKEQGVADAAEQRKVRSIAVMKREGVPYIEHLPVIESASEIRLRSQDEVALRAIALAVVAVKGEVGDHKMGLDLTKRFDVRSALSPDERAFIDNPNPSAQERANFSWRYEGLGVMLWALGFIDDLGRPDKVVDVPKAVGIVRDLGRDGIVAKAKLRSTDEILDQADLLYRYHWATTDARVNGREAPAGLDGGIVYERHYALNWLIRYMDQDWDDVSTDT